MLNKLLESDGKLDWNEFRVRKNRTIEFIPLLKSFKILIFLYQILLILTYYSLIND